MVFSPVGDLLAPVEENPLKRLIRITNPTMKHNQNFRAVVVSSEFAIKFKGHGSFGYMRNVILRRAHVRNPPTSR